MPVFSNGVAVTESGDILVNETGTYQVHRVSPNGDSRVIMENLPGFPDNINRGPKLSDGTETFLLGLVSQRSAWLDKNSNNLMARKIAMRLPAFLRPQAVNYGLIIQIDGEGRVIQTWQDPSGDYLSATGAIIAQDGYMYVSSLTAPDLGRLKNRGAVLRILVLAIFLGGLARLYSYLTIGPPPLRAIGGMVLELGAPVLALWHKLAFKKA